MTEHIKLEGEGAESLNRLTAAVERLEQALLSLSSTNNPLAQMQAQMRTGFAELGELVKRGGASITRVVKENGDATAEAVEAAGYKIKQADARTWEQIQKGSAANVAKAFNQLAQGIPVEAVRERMGELATATAEGLKGDLSALKQFQANAESLWETHYSRLAGATEAQMTLALEMDKAFDAKRLAQRVAATAKLTEASAAASWQSHLDLEAGKEATLERTAARARALDESSSAAAWRNYLDLEAKKISAEEARYAKQMSLDEAASAASWRNFLELEAKKLSATESQRVLNTGYLTASPASQVRTATQAQVYAGMGGNAAERYGSEAAAADALAVAEHRLAEATKVGGAAAIRSAADHEILNDVLKQTEGAFRGAAHQAGIYGLHHGQLIGLLAGGAVAAALHHIAETGAEVEFELANLNALSGQMEPIDINKFVGITSGTLTSIKDAAAGMAALAEAGMGQDRAMAALPDVMRLATLGNMTVAQSAEMAVESMHAFGKSDSDIGNIGDTLVAVGAKANVSVHKLAEDMKSAATTGQLFNLSMAEITATVGALAERGLTIQPLSSALNKLYEPSVKTAAVMKEWGLTVKNDAGGLKTYTDFMKELVDKVAEFKVPADALKQLGMPPQAIKSMEVMTQHWEDYKHLLHEAEDSHGKMFNAMLVKEDTAEGGFKRLASTVSGTFTEAFAAASPIVQALEEKLMHIAGDPATVAMFKQFATGVANLTTILVDHIGTIAAVAAAYVGLRIVASIITMIQTFKVEAAAAALAAEAMGAGAVVAAEGLTVAGAAVRGLTTAMGLIGIAITAATVAYELFGHKMSDAELLREKNNNTIDVTIDGYEREIARLKGVEEQLIITGEAGKKAAGLVALVHAENAVAQAETDLNKAAAAKPADSSLRMAARHGPTSRSSEQMQDDNIDALNAQLNKAIELRDKLKNAIAEEGEVSERVSKMMTVSDIQKKLKGYGSEEIKPVVNTAAAKAAAEEANKRIAALRAENFDTLDNAAATDHLVKAKKDLDAIDKLLLATKRDASPAAKADKSGLQASLQASQLDLDLRKMDMKMELNSLTQQYNRGEIGDLEMINSKLKEKLETNRMAVTVAQRQYDLVAASDKVNKDAALQKYTNAKAKAGKQDELDTDAAQQEIENYFEKQSQVELKIQAKTLADKGKLVDSFLLTYENEYGNMISRILSDLEKTSDSEVAGRLGSVLASLTRRQTSGVNDASFKQDQQAFAAALSSIQEQIATAKATATADGGLSGALGLAAASTRIQSDLLPQLARMVEQMNTIATGTGGTVAMVETANKAKTSLAKITSDLAKDAKPFGDAWDKVWKSVESSAHSAWMSIGTGGKNAFDEIGKVLKTAILDMLYQLTVKKWLVSIGASIGGTFGLNSAAGATGTPGAGAAGTAGSALSSIGTVSNMASSAGSLYAAGSNIYAAATGTGVTGMVSTGIIGDTIAGVVGGYTGTAAATSAALGGAELSTAATAGEMLAMVPGWGWAAAAIVAAYMAWGDKGPEDHTRIGFTSNNAAGNISINERGNEGKSNTYIGNQGTSSALGTFGVSSSFWAQDQSKTVTEFLKSVSQTDNALAAFMTSAEKASVSSYLTGKVSTAYTGHEGEDPNAHGELDGVFKDRIHNIMAGLGDGLAELTDNFKGTSQELATEAGKVLQFRQALQDGGVAVFGMTVTLQQLAALRAPAESASEAFTRITSVFNVTNQIASITGQSITKMFGSVGLASFDARNNLVQAAGGLTQLSTQVNSYSTNFLTKSQQNAGAMRQVTDVMASLNLSSVNSKAAFAKVVSGIDTTTPAGAKLFASLMSIQQAFSDVYSASEGVTIGLQDQLDQLTMTRAELLKKERDALDPVNLALFDQIQQQKRLATAKDAVSAAYDREVSNITTTNTRLKTLGDSLRSFGAGLSLGATSPLSVSQKYAVAKDQFESTVVKAKGGDTKAQDSLQSAAQAFLDASKAANASGGTFSNDFDTVKGVVDNMASWADVQVDQNKATLEALKVQIGGLVDIKDAVQSLPAALADLLGLQSSKGDLKAQVADVYRQVMGRAPDALTLARLANDVTYSGKTVAGLAKDLRASPEYAAQHAPDAYAYDGAGNTAEALADMAAEIARLNAQIAAYRKEAMMHTGHLADTFRTANADSADQISEATVAAARERIYAQQTGVTIE